MKTPRLRRLLAAAVAAASIGALAPATPAAAAANTAGEYRSLPTPTRVLDTRTGIGGVNGALVTGQYVDMPINGANGVVPATGITAVVLNLTAVAPTDGGFLTAWPSGEARPDVSNINFVPGVTVPNLVTVKVGTNGRVSVFNSNGRTHVLADVVGYYDDASVSGGWFNPVAPSRLLDTRTGNAGVGRAGGAAVGQGETISLAVAGRGGVPAVSGVSAVVLNITADAPTGAGFVSVWPSGGRPDVSTLNFAAGQTVANLAIVGVGADGTVKLFNSNGQTHLIADVVGYFDVTGSTGYIFTPISPIRGVDTRSGSPVGEDQGPHASPVDGAGLDTAVVRGLVMNVTATETTADSYFSVYRSDLPLNPDASSLNWKAKQTVPNLVMTEVTRPGNTAGLAPGLATVYNRFGQAHLIMDVVGYFTVRAA